MGDQAVELLVSGGLSSQKEEGITERAATPIKRKKPRNGEGKDSK